MRIGSLFSGIGGLELGLEWAGVGHTVWQVERDPFCRSVLERHWPDATRFDDVRTVGAHNLEPVDVICGGFPCQDISYAGKGLGLSGERSGLWYEFARIVGEMGPRFVVVENVAALITRGIGDVLGTLSDLGYDARWRAIRASDVGAPHRRERIFIVAYADNERNGHSGVMGQAGTKKDRRGYSQGMEVVDGRRAKLLGAAGDCAPLADAAGHSDTTRTKLSSSRDGSGLRGNARQRAKPESCVGRDAHGVPARVDRWPSGPGEAQHEWEPPRTIAKVDSRAARLRALGNAVVPQIAEKVGKWLLEINKSMPN